MSETPRILVAGTGPAGLIAALAFAEAGFGVILAGPGVADTDRRTTALMNPALALLDRIGVLDDLRPQAAPLKVMRIVDATALLIRIDGLSLRVI
jgi:2-octaprenyl-6-methoxyphenol hydroxylase